MSREGELDPGTERQTWRKGPLAYQRSCSHLHNRPSHAYYTRYLSTFSSALEGRALMNIWMKGNLVDKRSYSQASIEVSVIHKVCYNF